MQLKRRFVYQATQRAQIRLTQYCKYSFAADQYGNESSVKLILACKHLKESADKKQLEGYSYILRLLKIVQFI